MPDDLGVSNPSRNISSASFIGRLAGGVVLINLLVFGMVAYSLRQSYVEFDERAEMTTQNLSQMLAQDIGREFEKIDVVLLSAVDEIERQLAHGGASRQAVNAFLGRLQGRIPEIISLRTTDAAGIVTYGLGVDPKARPNNSDREYFIRQRDNPAAGMVVTKPVLARIDKKWVVPISRAFHRPDGSFGGIVYVNVSLDHLARVFSSIDVGRRGAVSLRDDELRILAHYPVPANADTVLGRRLDVPELQAFIQSRQESGTYVTRHTLDRVERKFAVRKVPDYPLYAVVGRATDEYMTAWREQAWKMVMLAAFFCLSTVVFSWLVVRSWRRQLATTMELAREEEKFHTVADYTYDWEYWEGPDRRLLFMSPSCERVTGYSAAEFVSDSGLLMRIIHPEDRHLMDEHLRDIAHEDTAVVDFRIARKDGELRWISHACRAVYGHNGKSMGRRVSNRDITERRQAEAALMQLNAELEQRVAQRTAQLETAIYDLENFNYSASHDLRIPLRAIDGFSRILLDEYAPKLDAEGKRLLNVIRDNTGKMAQFIDDMLAFSRTGRMQMEPAEINMDELVHEVVDELKPAFAGRELRIDVLPLPSLFADRQMMRRVWTNLLANAVKFTRHQSAAQVEVGAKMADGETVWYVRDNGVGFDMKYVGKLFGVFQRLHGPTEFEGTGIGLAIVKRIVARHGGRVWAEGKVGAGATFYFALPPRAGEGRETEA